MSVKNSTIESVFKNKNTELEYYRSHYKAWKYAEDIICAWCGEAQGCSFGEDCVQYFMKENGILIK